MGQFYESVTYWSATAVPDERGGFRLKRQNQIFSSSVVMGSESITGRIFTYSKTWRFWSRPLQED